MDKLITDEQAYALFTALMERGVYRWREQGASFSEPDYLAAVGTAMHELGHWDKVPPYWWFAIARGDTVLSAELHAKYKGDEAVWTLTRADIRSLLRGAVSQEMLDNEQFIDEVRDEVREALWPTNFRGTVLRAAKTAAKYWGEGEGNE